MGLEFRLPGDAGCIVLLGFDLFCHMLLVVGVALGVGKVRFCGLELSVLAGFMIDRNTGCTRNPMKQRQGFVHEPYGVQGLGLRIWGSGLQEGNRRASTA